MTVSRDYSTLLLIFNELSNTQNLLRPRYLIYMCAKSRKYENALFAENCAKQQKNTCLRTTIYVFMIPMKREQMNYTINSFAVPGSLGATEDTCYLLIG